MIHVERNFLELRDLKNLKVNLANKSNFLVKKIKPDFQLNKFFYKQIGKKYNASDIYCGPLDKKESDYIFGKKAKIKDCVLVPIKNTDCPGVLALGSKNENTYSKENDSLFLEFVAETLSKLIDRNNF